MLEEVPRPSRSPPAPKGLLDGVFSPARATLDESTEYGERGGSGSVAALPQRSTTAATVAAMTTAQRAILEAFSALDDGSDREESEAIFRHIYGAAALEP